MTTCRAVIARRCAGVRWSRATCTTATGWPRRCDAHRVAAVMHFAAFAYVGELVTDPELYYRNNVVGTLSLLDAMREAGVATIVFSSTCAIYGIPDSRADSRDDRRSRRSTPTARPSWRSSARCTGTAGLWLALRRAALFQCRRRRSRRRDRRRSRSRNPPDPARPAGRARSRRPLSTSSAPIIRRRTARRSATTSMCQDLADAHLRALELSRRRAARARR